MSPDQSASVVLFVEDEILIQDTVQAALTEAGFKVETAVDAAAATLILSASLQLRALITDVNLGPGPDGWAVARRAREIVPRLPVIYVSGASSHEWTSQGVPDSVMIQKPF